MKVLQVIDELDVGGAEQVSVDIAILLSKETGINVTFLCLLEESTLDAKLIEHNIPIIYLNRKNKFSILRLIELKSILNKFDVIHIHSRHVLRYIGLTFFSLFKRKYKIVFHDHYGKIDIDTSITKYLKFCINRCNAYIGVSTSLINWAHQHKIKATLFLLSNIIIKTEQKRILKTCGDIVVIGNFRPQKNYKFLCNLVSKLPKNISVDLYGNIGDKAYYNSISKLTNDLELNDRIQVIHNKISVGEFLRNYKLAVHCAASETGPLVAIEYLSQGLPIVMFETGEVSNIILKYDTDLIMNNFEINNWKRIILKLLNNNNYRKEKSNILSDIYNNNFSEKKYIQKCLKIYQSIQIS